MSHEPDESYPDPTPFRAPNTPWSDRPRSERVVYARRAGGYARRPDRAKFSHETAARRAVELTNGELTRTIELGDGVTVFVVEYHEDDTGVTVEDLLDRLHFESFEGEPDYVMFANPVYANPVYANPVYANPVYANPVYANPVYANPVYANPVTGHASGGFANPVYANPVYASPVYANPVYSNPVYANSYICGGVRPSTARPAVEPFEPKRYEPTPCSGRIVVLDTGIASTAKNGRQTRKRYCPRFLRPLAEHYPNQFEWPHDPNRHELVTEDHFLEPVSGHGTFIAGIFQTLIPGTEIVPWSVVTSYGDVSVLTVIEAISHLLHDDRGLVDERTVINMSFGGYADERMHLLRLAVRCLQKRGAVVVASAGNDATDRPSFPACLPGVVGVAALDSSGPAPYTNHGRWVSACAPGTDLVSSFFDWNGPMDVPKMPGSVDPDDFTYWARWTGTSFAAPIVAAALLRHMSVTHTDARRAVKQVIEAPGLFRLPDLGTVVNLHTVEPSCI